MLGYPSAGCVALSLSKTNLRMLFPLPEGEGQGEGEARIRRTRSVAYPNDSSVKISALMEAFADSEQDESIFRHGLPWAEAEPGGNLLGLRQHHAGLAGDGDELETFGDPSLGRCGIEDMNPWRHTVPFCRL